jgi:hypothetical protein
MFNIIQALFHTNTLDSAIFQQNALSKLDPITGRIVRNFKLSLNFCLIGISLKKCATFAPFLVKTKIQGGSDKSGILKTVLQNHTAQLKIIRFYQNKKNFIGTC